MKDKDIVDVLRAEVGTSLEVFSAFSKIDFKLHTNDAVLYKDDSGKHVAHFGLIIEAVKEGKTKKLYDRRYKVGNSSLRAVQLVAYRELLDLMVGTFLMTAEKANNQMLKAVSNPELVNQELNKVGESLETLPVYEGDTQTN